MSEITTDQVLLAQFKQLDSEQQRRVMEYIRLLAPIVQVRGESGSSILKSVGMFQMTDLDEMANAIEEGCERIDWSGWE